MDRWFELWDARAASLVGTYDDQDAALAVVRDSLAAFGAESIESLILTEEYARGDGPRVVAAGLGLATLARPRRSTTSRDEPTRR
jgi:hypothetical protein